MEHLRLDRVATLMDTIARSGVSRDVQEAAVDALQKFRFAVEDECVIIFAIFQWFASSIRDATDEHDFSRVERVLDAFDTAMDVFSLTIH